MIAIIILTGLVILGIYLHYKDRDDIGTGLILSVVFGILLFIVLITIPIERIGFMSQIERYNAFKQTIELSRKKGSLTEIERAAIQKDIAKWNQDIAQVKYYNKYFDLWIPDEVTKLEPLE